VVRIEEDWELVVGQPDTTSNGPQVTCTMSATGSLSGVNAAFEVNHRSQPSYAPGGLALQVWYGESFDHGHQHASSAQLNTPGESVTWRQVARLQDGRLYYEIVNGSSLTWGAFGDTSGLRHSWPSELTDLSGYDSAVSVENSGVGFAGNRVTSLTLVAVRGYAADGTLLFEETEPQVVHVSTVTPD
jgi:hypothetical protein